MWMSGAELLVGAVVLAMGIFGFWIALPRDGQVRSFLRNDNAQAYYTVTLIVLVAFGPSMW
jgi:hypothetical protein